MAAADDAILLMVIAAMLLYFVYELCRCCCSRIADQLDSLDQRTAQATSLPSPSPSPPLPPPPQLVLPCFPYVTEGGRASGETTQCAICLDEFRMGQLCSEVPACRHAFHRDCLGAWAKSKATCPLCRAMIVPGSDGVALADDMV